VTVTTTDVTYRAELDPRAVNAALDLACLPLLDREDCPVSIETTTVDDRWHVGLRRPTATTCLVIYGAAEARLFLAALRGQAAETMADHLYRWGAREIDTVGRDRETRFPGLTLAGQP